MTILVKFSLFTCTFSLFKHCHSEANTFINPFYGNNTSHSTSYSIFETLFTSIGQSLLFKLFFNIAFCLSLVFLFVCSNNPIKSPKSQLYNIWNVTYNLQSFQCGFHVTSALECNRLNRVHTTFHWLTV